MRPQAPLKVVLIDDHPLILAGIASLLQSAPDINVVGQAMNATSAIAVVGDVQPDLCVLDMGLPGMNGLALAESLLQLAPQTLLVMLTQLEESSFVQRALNAGFRGYVLKASPPERVLQAIRTVMGGGIFIDSDLRDFRSDYFRQLARTKSADLRGAFGQLTEREQQVLRLVAVGHSNKAIARILNLGVKSIETYRYRACKKLALKSRFDIIRHGATQGWLADL